MPEEEKKGGFGLWAVGGLLIALLGYGAFNYIKKDSVSEMVQNEDLTPTDLPETPTTPVLGRAYRDGTYTAEGNYTSPGGDEKIEVTIVLKDDVISDVTVKSLATLPVSINLQGQFISGVKEQVIGKKLDEVNLTKVSGSSLTPKGWNDAVAKIQLQAKA